MPRLHGSVEQLYGGERLGRPRPEAIQHEFRWLPGGHVHVYEVVILLGSLALPILIQRVAIRDLDMRPARKDWVLFCTPTTKEKVLYAIDIVDLGRVYVSIEDDYVQVFRVGGDRLVGILSLRDGSHTGAGESRVLETDEHLLCPRSLSLVQPHL